MSLSQLWLILKKTVMSIFQICGVRVRVRVGQEKLSQKLTSTFTFSDEIHYALCKTNYTQISTALCK